MNLDLTPSETDWLEAHLRTLMTGITFPDGSVGHYTLMAMRDNVPPILNKIKRDGAAVNLGLVREIHEGKPHQAVFRTR